MIKKVYKQIISKVKENYRFVFFLIALYFVLTIPLPYYIHTTGGLINISDKVKIEDEYDKRGSINLSYVTELRGTVLTCLLSYVIPSWDLINQENYVAGNETYEDVDYRNHLLLEEANTNAMMVAYGEANKDVTIKDEHYFVIYIDEAAHTTLKIGDEIVSVNGIQIKSMKDYIDVVARGKIGNSLDITVTDKNNKIRQREATIFTHDNTNVTGIIVATKYNYEAHPKIEFSFRESESGPSGGLMMTLAIYDKLVRDDLTKGLKVVGTGTIDRNGNVGEISGIEYKLKGAIDAKADIFFAPLGENYNEVVALKKKNKYNISIVGVATFRDALNYLKSI